MKSFGIKLIPFVVGAASFWLLGWYQANFHAHEGDLVRTGFLITQRHYEDPDPIPTARDTAIHDILLVGDSHLNQSPTNRRFQEHITIPMSVHSHWSYEGSLNPITLGVSLARKQKPKLVVFEMVERNLVHFALDHLHADSIETPPIITTRRAVGSQVFSHLGNGVRTSAALLNIRHKWLKNDQSKVLTSRSSPPLHSHDQILITKKVWERRKPPGEVTSIINSVKQVLTQQLEPFRTEFIIYVIPDKATVYSDFFECSDLHPSFLLNGALPDKIHSPVHAMRRAVNDGIMEVYKYSDTHLGVNGAQITGTHLNGILEGWQKTHPASRQPQ